MKKLSPEDQQAFLTLCETALGIKSVTQFNAWMHTHVHAFFPFGMMVAVLGSILDQTIFIERLICIGYPAEFVPQLQLEIKLSDRPLVARWYRERTPQIINADETHSQLSPFELEQMRKYDKRNFAVHGMVDIQGQKGSYISFSRLPDRLTEHHREKLTMMAPQLHQVLCSLQDMQAPRPVSSACALSDRQREVLRLVARGKTNREIAAQLQRSESTIRNHVHTILANLGVANRTEASARLLQIGSFDP
jgi:transcriptional regulator EpsA